MRGYRIRGKSWVGLVLSTTFILLIVATQSGWLNTPAQKIEQGQPGFYQISRFVDGDTIAVDMGGSIETVRMIGIDTPETHKPNTPVQCYGPEAANYTKQLIGSGKVRLQADPLNTNRDRYNRLLRYVYLQDGTLLESKLISDGYAFEYPLFPFSKSNEFQITEQAAKQAGRGLWTVCQVTTAINGSKHTNPIQ